MVAGERPRERSLQQVWWREEAWASIIVLWVGSVAGMPGTIQELGRIETSKPSTGQLYDNFIHPHICYEALRGVYLGETYHTEPSEQCEKCMHRYSMAHAYRVNSEHRHGDAFVCMGEWHAWHNQGIHRGCN